MSQAVFLCGRRTFTCLSYELSSLGPSAQWTLRSNHKNDAQHAIYTQSLSHYRNHKMLLGRRLEPRTLGRTGINARSSGGTTYRTTRALKTPVRSFPILLHLNRLFCTLSYPHFVVQNWYVMPISPSPHHTHPVPQSLFAYFHPSVCLGSTVGTLCWCYCPFHRYWANTRTMQARDTRQAQFHASVPSSSTIWRPSQVSIT
jgi:hypothetical protein